MKSKGDKMGRFSVDIEVANILNNRAQFSCTSD
jgi:hypothetical protein